MTAKEILLTKRLIGHLRTAEKIADQLEITLGNGGEVGSLIGSMADELDLQLANLPADSPKLARHSLVTGNEDFAF